MHADQETRTCKQIQKSEKHRCNQFIVKRRDVQTKRITTQTHHIAPAHKHNQQKTHIQTQHSEKLQAQQQALSYMAPLLSHRMETTEDLQSLVQQLQAVVPKIKPDLKNIKEQVVA